VTRTIEQRYDDPLDLIWLSCAAELGIAIARSDEVYASFDGAGTLTLSTRAHFDADDSLAQLIFHELCHALVAPPRARRRPDWGMENVDARDLLQEHACHRLQAALADRHGLRALFAVTTDHRPYWDALPIDPLGPGDDPAIPIARDGFERATSGEWSVALEQALSQTAALARMLRQLPLPSDSLWRSTRPLHASGFPVGESESSRCGDCAWSYRSGARMYCRQTRAKRAVAAEHRACVRFEHKLDERACGSCGACCREGFDRVELGSRERVQKRHSLLVATDGFGAHLPRPGGRCVALEGGGGGDAPHRCTIYEDRPRACAAFEIGGAACLEARRRVGLSV
jgi:hypothetical protein